MATKKRWAGTKPATKPRKVAPLPKVPAAPKQPPKPELPDTLDGCVERITALCKQVDAEMAKPDRPSRIGLRFPPSNSPLHQVRVEVDMLVRRVGQLLPQEDEESAESYLAKRLAMAPGDAPSWGLPGTFLLWLGDIPVRCEWQGFIDPGGWFVAADPRQPWIDRDMAPPVYCSNIPDNVETPRALFWQTLAARSRAVGYERNRQVPAMQFQALEPEETAEIARYLAEHAWLQAALKRGPVDPVPLPPHLRTVQMPLIA